MQKNIVADTSCLILLDKIEMLYLLDDLYGKILVTDVIAKEFEKKLPDFIQIENPVHKKNQQILESYLDPGEASAIALALEKENCLLIMDELKGRHRAKMLELNVTGTLGIFILAKEKKIITSVTEVLDKIVHTNFRISSHLLKEVKKRCNEKA